MNILVVLIVLILLFGGGGWYVSGPHLGGVLVGFLMLVLIVLALKGRL